MKRILYIVMSVAATMPVWAAGSDVSLLKVTKINIGRQADEMVVALDVDPRMVKPGRDREVVFTPVIRSLTSADSIVLPTMKIAGRNRYYSHLRNGDMEEGDKVTLSGSDEKIIYRSEMQWQPWMDRCRVVMREDVGNCCDAPEPVTTTPLAELDYTVEPFVPEFRYVALTGDSTIELTAEGRAYVNFVVNRTELKPDYMTNPEEIGKIIASIDRVKNDPDATITRITIKGYASPEGSYSNNVRLAMGRTQTLKEYVRNYYNFDPRIMSTDYEPEDWDGLREWLLTSTLPHRDDILALVDSDMEPDPKNETIKRQYPEEYATILADVYPWLRHSDYTVKYAIRTYVDIDELKAVYASAPERLRPVDFQRIASTCETGSPEWREVMMTAVATHPADEKSNLNAANIAMAAGDLNAAAGYLARAGELPETIYARGVLAARQGDEQRAAMLMQAAAELGVDIAAMEVARLKSMRSRPTVKYFIHPQE